MTARPDLAESKARGKGTIGRAMIEHLRGRDRKLELLGWTGRDAEWIALVCLHSGVFTRAQFCQYFDTPNRVRAQRFVKALLARKQAVEIEWPIMNGGAKTCRISSKAIYRALGVENIRHRRQASNLVAPIAARHDRQVSAARPQRHAIASYGIGRFRFRTPH